MICKIYADKTAEFPRSVAKYRDLGSEHMCAWYSLMCVIYFGKKSKVYLHSIDDFN